MGRLGMNPKLVAPFLEGLKDTALDVDGIFTHLARADEPDVGLNPQAAGCF